MTFNKRECRTIAAALHRAHDWSDYYDNRRAEGRAWARRERSLLKRFEALLDKLNRAPLWRVH